MQEPGLAQVSFWYLVAGVLVGGTQAVLFFRWLYWRMRDDEIVRACVRDMATRQIPYFNRCMRLMADERGVQLPDAPPVQWVDLNGRYR